MNIEVKQVSLEATANTERSERGVRVDRALASGERWGLYVNGILIGDAKARFDADHAKVMLLKALTPTITDAAESLEECAGLLAEVHIRFGAPKVLDVDVANETEFTFGEAAKMYDGQANELRRLLAPPVTAADVSRVLTEEEIRKRRPGLFR